MFICFFLYSRLISGFLAKGVVLLFINNCVCGCVLFVNVFVLWFCLKVLGRENGVGHILGNFWRFRILIELIKEMRFVGFIVVLLNCRDYFCSYKLKGCFPTIGKSITIKETLPILCIFCKFSHILIFLFKFRKKLSVY